MLVDMKDHKRFLDLLHVYFYCEADMKSGLINPAFLSPAYDDYCKTTRGMMHYRPVQTSLARPPPSGQIPAALPIEVVTPRVPLILPDPPRVLPKAVVHPEITPALRTKLVANCLIVENAKFSINLWLLVKK